MVGIKTLLTGLLALAQTTCVLAHPVDDVTLLDDGASNNETARGEQFFELLRRQSTPSSTGRHNGYYYSWWTDGASPVRELCDPQCW